MNKTNVRLRLLRLASVAGLEVAVRFDVEGVEAEGNLLVVSQQRKGQTVGGRAACVTGMRLQMSGGMGRRGANAEEAEPERCDGGGGHWRRGGHINERREYV